MCGIAGYAGSRPPDRVRVDACLNLMNRRGPDHADSVAFEPCPGRFITLLHSRLSIIDLDARADQPFCAGGKTLVYNGELYNFIEIREQLAREGVRFRTESDTEVLLAAIDRWGVDALDRCEGMWAFAIYDDSTGELFLSRDRFGEKPLHLFRDQHGLYFGSEVKFIAALRGRPPAVDTNQIRRFLVNGYKAIYKQPGSFFEQVTELTPGTSLRIDRGGRETVHSYWTPRAEADESIGFEDAVAEIRRRLIDAVRLRLRADVPMAFCMSGGVDSNSLIAIARNLFDYDVHGFTIVDSDGRYDEEAIVTRTAANLGVKHTTVRTRVDDFLPQLRRLVVQHDAPVYTISYYAHWLLMAEIRRAGYRISVSGSAADELFTGYYDHHLAFLREVARYPDVHAAALAGWSRFVKPIVRNPYLSDPELFCRDPDFRDHIYLNADRFASYLTSPWSEPFEEHPFTADLLRNRMLNELFFEAVPVILHEDDLNAMYFSIENRSPFLDRRLFEFCYRIPTRHLIRDGAAKAVLRESMRGIVADEILDNRHKIGFNAAIHSFLDAADPEVRSTLLDDSPIFEIVRRDKIATLLDAPTLPNSESKFLFSFITSKFFLEQFAA
ncbi:MAG TPA: asparagine synthase (glutamine-hydrolyzing) [Vicinamibacterales bacterium]|nr:asparagine synthase (glutamine-hydrolyzing) [Vicinamibacterales bacterium]